LLLLVVVVEVATSWHCQLQSEVPAPASLPQERKVVTAQIKGYARPEEDTYLSYPEWYIVWSYQEKADFQQEHLPSGFPYFSAVQQYWVSYCCISRLTAGKYPFNAGEQIMLVAIGTSFSAEYILKGAYEKTVGRASEWISGNQPVEEDRYAYRVAREYADFVHIRPFYEFHFAHHVNGLWTETPFWGSHWLRKCERKAFLSVDYTLEAFYCWLIEKATHATYGYEPADTFAWIDNANPDVFQRLPRMKGVKQVGPRAFIVDIPRYQEFTGIASKLAERGVRFIDIAGNSRIIVSVIAPESWHYERSEAQQLFSSVILTHPETKRVVIGCDVGWLTDGLRELHAEGIELEHVYDY
jgi:hypothetical protein